MEQTVEQRLTELEKVVAELKSAERDQRAKTDWRNRIGKFQDDPGYEEAMRLGRRYRRRQPKC